MRAWHGHADAVGAARHPEELEGKAPEHLRQRKRQDAEENACVPHADVAEKRSNDQRAEHGRPRCIAPWSARRDPVTMKATV